MGGEFYMNNITDSGGWVMLSSVMTPGEYLDIYFPTWVDPVPEPSSLLALLGGPGGLAVIAWRRR